MGKGQPQQPKGPNIAVRVLGFMLIWIMVPVACFGLGMLVIGPRFVPAHTPAPMQQDPDDSTEPRHASDWLNGQQLPTRLGPVGEAGPRYTRTRHKVSHAKKGQPADDTVDTTPPPDDNNPTDQPTDQQPPDQPKDNGSGSPPDVQKPDGIN